jgi:hypothetical protein
MDTYSKNRIETITEKDFWSSIRKIGDTRSAIEAGLAGRRAGAYRLLGEYHARSLASEAADFVASVHQKSAPEKIRLEADRVLRHEIQGWHTEVRQFGPVIDFNADYGQSGQYGFHYLQWLIPVLHQYVLGGQVEYRDGFIEIIKQYYEQRTRIIRRIPHLHPVYYELGAWSKANLILPAYALMAGDPALDTDAREAILKLLLGFARSLYRLQKNGYRAGNWQIVGCQALYGIGAAFAEFREAAAWRRRGEEIIAEHAQKDFFADGGHGERCWGYGIMSLNGMAGYYQSAIRHGFLTGPRRARWSRFLKRGYRWFAESTAPGLMMLNYGDGDISSAQGIIDQAQERFPDLKRQSGVLGVDRARSNILRPSGYAFMRCGAEPEAPFMSINFGGWGGGHTHQDLLDFTLWRYGQPLIEEVGRFGSYDHPLNPRFRAAESHNQIVLDHLDMDRKAHQGRDVRWVSTDRIDLFSAWHEGYGCARIQRQIAFLKPDAWLMYDVVTSKEYIFQATNCLHGVRPFKNLRPGVWRLEGRPSCLVVSAQPDQIRRIVTGIDYDRRDYGERVATTPAYQHERHHLRLSQWRDVGDARPIVFTTLMVPFNGRVPDVSLRSLPVRGDHSGQAGAFEVSLNGRTFQVVFNPAEVPVKVGRKQFKTWAAVIPADKRYEITTDGMDLTENG